MNSIFLEYCKYKSFILYGTRWRT